VRKQRSALRLSLSTGAVLDLAAVGHHQIHAELLDGLARLHHCREQKRAFFVNGVPTLADKVQDLAGFVALGRHFYFNIATTSKKKIGDQKKNL
jgi:hypothetical protein